MEYKTKTKTITDFCLFNQAKIITRIKLHDQDDDQDLKCKTKTKTKDFHGLGIGLVLYITSHQF